MLPDNILNISAKLIIKETEHEMHSVKYDSVRIMSEGIFHCHKSNYSF